MEAKIEQNSRKNRTWLRCRWFVWLMAVQWWRIEVMAVNSNGKALWCRRLVFRCCWSLSRLVSFQWCRIDSKTRIRQHRWCALSTSLDPESERQCKSLSSANWQAFSLTQSQVHVKIQQPQPLRSSTSFWAVAQWCRRLKATFPCKQSSPYTSDPTKRQSIDKIPIPNAQESWICQSSSTNCCQICLKNVGHESPEREFKGNVNRSHRYYLSFFVFSKLVSTLFISFLVCKDLFSNFESAKNLLFTFPNSADFQMSFIDFTGKIKKYRNVKKF